MNDAMTREQYEALPDRQGYNGHPVHMAKFRDSAYPGTVFWYMQDTADLLANRHQWWAFSVRFIETKPNASKPYVFNGRAGENVKQF